MLSEYVLYAIHEGATALAGEGVDEDTRAGGEVPSDLADAIDNAYDALQDLERVLKKYRDQYVAGAQVSPTAEVSA